MSREKPNRSCCREWSVREWLLVLFLWTAPAYAQEVAEVPGPMEPDTEVDERLWSVYGGVHFGSPLRLAGAVTILWDVKANQTYAWDAGPSLRVEAGMSGARVALGYTSLGGCFYSGTSIRAAALWTRDWLASPLAAPADRTYVGGEYAVTMLGASGTVGAYRSVSSPGEDSWLIGWSVGIGF